MTGWPAALWIVACAVGLPGRWDRHGVVRLKAHASAIGAQHRRDRTWTAPTDAAERRNPLAIRTDAETGGRKVFVRRCARCHADDAGGTLKGPDLTSPAVQAESDGALFWKITQGNTLGGMPTFSFLPEIQRSQLVLHIRAAADAARR